VTELALSRANLNSSYLPLNACAISCHGKISSRYYDIFYRLGVGRQQNDHARKWL
jgi:hypothetical protein